MKEASKGKGITKHDAWLLEIAKIPDELRKDEAELRLSRWFDYRDLNAVQLTYLFADRYDTIYREFYAKTIDEERAEKVRTLIGKDVFESPELIGVWRARQAADAIGCKYDFYLRFAFNRFFERGWKYAPRPNQMYGEELVMDVKDAWDATLQCTLQLANRKRFQAGNYEGHPDQDAYHSYLVDMVKTREHKHLILSRLVLKERILPQSIAEKHFDNEVLRRAEIL